MGDRRKKRMRALLWTVTAVLAAGTVLLYARDSRPEGAVTQEPAAIAGQTDSRVLDLNAAGVQALEELPGVGPVLAERIVAARTENGPFDGEQALMQVQGVGPALWEDIEPFVYFGEQ